MRTPTARRLHGVGRRGAVLLALGGLAVALLPMSAGGATARPSAHACAPTLTLKKKVVNNGGGTAAASQWTLSATGSSGSFSGNGPSTGAHNVTAGVAYTLAESGPGGYQASGWSCSGGSLDGSTLTLKGGESVTCTITNTYIPPPPPTLTLTKTVSGGTASATEWTLSATGSSGSFSGNGPSTGAHTVTAGVAYTLAESGPGGYQASGWSCSGGSLDGSSITLQNGDAVTCGITNTAVSPPSPTLTLTKTVVNDNGGTATASQWTLSATGGSGSFSGNGPSTGAHTVTAGVAYTLAESGPGSYQASSWYCNGEPLEGSTVTLANGDAVTCAITNNDVPSPPPPPPPPPEQPKVDLAITKADAPDPVEVGDTITYTMTVTNVPLAGGSFTASNVTVTDPLPPGTEYVSVATSQGTCSFAGGGLSCDLGSLVAGGSVQITLVVRATVTGTVTNTTTVTGSDPETDSTNNTASATTTVLGPYLPPAVAVCATMRVTPVSLRVGHRTTVVVRVRDQRGKALRGAVVTLKGPGISVRAKTTKLGVVKRKLAPKRPGKLVVRVAKGPPACRRSVGIVGTFQPPQVTG